MTYHDRLRLIKLGLAPKEAIAKKPKPIRKISEKKQNELQENKNSDNKLDDFFERNRKKMVGVCQCGCARKSSKKEDDFYRSSIAHIFPKKTFKSIATNDLNWVERNFWEGCHTNMDNRSIEKWPMFADWDDIKEKYYILAPQLTEEEKKTKFYSALTKLVYT